MMKNVRIQLLIPVLILLGLGAWFSTVRATEQTAGSSAIVSNIVLDDLLVAGRSVLVQAEVKGDVITAGSDVTIKGDVLGYVIAAGSHVTVSGPVGNDLWAAGATVNVSAPIADNALLAGRVVNLLPGAEVKHDASIAGGTVSVRGRIERNLKLAADEAQLASEVGGSVEAHTRRFKLLPGAVVRGNLVVYGPQAPEISAQAQVLGRVTYHKVEESSARAGFVARLLFMFLPLLVLGCAALALSPLWAQRVSAMIVGKPWVSLFTGLVGVLLVPLTAVFLLVTVVGLPLAFILLALYVVALLLSGVFVAHLLGGWLLNRLNHPQASPYVRVAVGAFAVAFCAALPGIGVLIRLVILLIGFGALVLEQSEFVLRLRTEGLA
jgi:hypothetical protein